jgi:hypothetical protein
MPLCHAALHGGDRRVNRGQMDGNRGGQGLCGARAVDVAKGTARAYMMSTLPVAAAIAQAHLSPARKARALGALRRGAG